MNTPGEPQYTIRHENGRMAFRTASFSAEGVSVLHSDIYSRELSSLLSSTALAAVLSMFFFVQGKKSFFSYLLIVIVLVGAFPVFRTFIFRERYLEAVFTAETGFCEIIIAGLGKKRIAGIEKGGIRQVLVETKKTKVDNPDAVEFVERISAQHGASIPHFSKEMTSYLLMLKRSDGSDILLFASDQMDEAVSAQSELREYLEVNRMLA